MNIQTNNQSNKPVIYFTYCRKSSEAEDKQALSIESQKDENDKTAKMNNLNILETLEESKSAKHPGRPIFDKMILDIEKGKANGILVWNPNRISRNSIDTGKVIYLMDEGKLAEVRTPSQIFRNNPNDKFLLNLFCSQAKLENDNKGVDVKRGLRKKASMGYPNGIAKIGYLNDKSEEKGNRTWYDDPIRLPLVSILFGKFLTGRYSVRQIWRMAKFDLQLTTPERKKEGGKFIALSYVYRMLIDPIYAGFFYQGGERYELNKKLSRIITEDQYWQIQKMLGKNGRPQPQKRDGLYNHFMFCDDCKTRTSPDFKFQIICPVCKLKFSYINREDCPNCKEKISNMEDPVYLSYVYYRCLRCKKSIEQKNIHNFLKDYISNNLQISKELSEWCIKHLDEVLNKELEEIEAITSAKVKQETELKNKLNRLLEERLRRGDLSPIEIELFDTQEKKLLKEIELVTKENENKEAPLETIEDIKKRFSLMAEINDIFENGTDNDKREALYILRSNLNLKEKSVDIINIKSICLFIECINLLKSRYPSLEPKTIKDLSTKNEAFAPFIPTLLPE